MWELITGVYKQGQGIPRKINLTNLSSKDEKPELGTREK